MDLENSYPQPNGALMNFEPVDGNGTASEKKVQLYAQASEPWKKTRKLC
jgi:hypothetical protein